jgi:osmotically-inducible protein OsmY
MSLGVTPTAQAQQSTLWTAGTFSPGISPPRPRITSGEPPLDVRSRNEARVVGPSDEQTGDRDVELRSREVSQMRKRAWAAGASVAAIGGWLARRSKSLTMDASPYLHRTVNHARGLAYRATRRQPSTTVDDAVLADRIRSSIGPLEKRLHNSRINVPVETGIAILHGDIEAREAATQIEEAERGVAGVRDIRSHLSH